MTLKITRSMLPHLCTISIPKLQTSICFALWPALLELQGIWRQGHWTTPEWPWALQGQGYHTYVLLVPWVSPSIPFALWSTVFKTFAIFPFPIMPQFKFQTFFHFYFKFQERTFKNPKGSFMKTTEKKIQEKFDNFRLRYLGGYRFEPFVPFVSHVN